MVDNLSKEGTPDEISKPLQEFLNRLFGSAAEEANNLLADRVKYTRWRTSLKIIEKAQKELDGRGIAPHNIPLKTLIPILEGASLESDDTNLQTKWINLLATAASGNSLHPSYAKILSEITQTEAQLLDYVFNESNKQSSVSMYSIKSSLSLSNGHFPELIDNLVRLQICNHPIEGRNYHLNSTSIATSIPITRVDRNSICLTALGKNFLDACHGIKLDRSSPP